MDDFSRQIDLFDPRAFTTPVHIIGCGATGSWAALQLAKMGIANVSLYDFDIVEMHNLPNQYFGFNDIGENKAIALSNRIKELTGFEYKAFNKKVTGEDTLGGYVMILTDTMASRKDIWHNAIRLKPLVKLCVETRMGLKGGNVYAINPNNYELITEYDKTLLATDDEAEVSSCGTSLSVAATAVLIANHAVWRIIAHHLDGNFPVALMVGGEAGFNIKLPL